MNDLKKLLAPAISTEEIDARIKNKKNMPTYDTNKISSDNLDLLIDIYKKNPSKIVPFLGAGVSTACGIRGWGDLMKGFCTKFEELEQYNKIDFKSEPEYFEYIHNEIGSDRYFEFLNDWVEPTAQSTSIALIDMVKACDVFLTTNIDMVIPNTFNWVKKTIAREKPSNLKNFEVVRKILPDIDYERAQENRKIIYFLHGFKGNENQYVFRSSEYDYFYNRSDDIKRLLKSFYEKCNLLFCGFSFADVYVNKVFEEILDTEKGIENVWESYKSEYKPEQHFLIMRESAYTDNIASRKDWFDSKGFSFIIYKHHIFVEKLMGFLLSIKYEEEQAW